MAVGGGGSGQAGAIRAGSAFVELTAKSDQLKAGLAEAKQRLGGFAEASKKMFAGLGGAGAIGGLLGGVEGLSGLAGLATMFGPHGLLVGGGLMLGKHLWEAATASDEVGDGLEKARTMADLAAASAKRFADELGRAAGNTGELARIGQNRLAELRAEMQDLAELKRLLESGGGDSGRIRELEGKRGIQARTWKPSELAEIKKRMGELTTEYLRFANGTDDASSAIQQKVADATKALEAQTRAMEQDTKTMGMSAAAKDRYKASQDGVNEAFLRANALTEKDNADAAKRLKDQQDAIKAMQDHRSAVDALTKSLERQIETHGMSADEAAIHDLAKLKGSDAEIKRLRELAAEKKRLDNLPESTRKAFREAFGGGGVKGFGTSVGAFQSANFRQLLGGGTGDDGKQLTKLTDIKTVLDQINAGIEKLKGTVL